MLGFLFLLCFLHCVCERVLPLLLSLWLCLLLSVFHYAFPFFYPSCREHVSEGYGLPCLNMLSTSTSSTGRMLSTISKANLSLNIFDVFSGVFCCQRKLWASYILTKNHVPRASLLEIVCFQMVGEVSRCFSFGTPVVSVLFYVD